VPESGPIREDDPSIPDSEELYRQILAEWIVREQSSGRQRFSSQTFADRNNEISVDLSSLTSPEACLGRGGARFIGIAALMASHARALGQVIVRDPIPADNPEHLPEDLAHALICGPQPHSVRKRLAQNARWVYPADANPLG